MEGGTVAITVANIATVLSSIPASPDTVESKGRQMKQCIIKYCGGGGVAWANSDDRKNAGNS